MSFYFNPVSDPFFELYPVLGQERKRRGTRFSIGNSTQLQKCLTITDEFINHLMSKKKKQDEDKKIIVDFLSMSNLMTKIGKDSNANDGVSIKDICNGCVDILQYERLNKGSNVYKIGEVGDKCYFLLRGKIDELTPKQIPHKYSLSFHEYLLYLYKLKTVNETFILNEIMKANRKTIPFDSIDDYVNFTDCYVRQKIRQLLIDETLTPETINQVINEFGKTYKKLRMDEKEIETKYNLFSQMKDFNYNWGEYILKYTKSSVEELAFFDRMRSGIQRDMNKKLEIIAIKYEKIASLSFGDFFGDGSLDEENRIRPSTMRAEVDCILGYMKYDDYVQLIFPKQKKTKLKLISFLFDNYFFSSIASSLFEKYYLHFFKQYDALQKTVINIEGNPVYDLKLIELGQVKVSITCSIIEMHNMIKSIIDKLIQINSKNQSITELIDLKQEYLNDFELFHMKNRHIKDYAFSSEMQKKQVFQLYTLKENDIIGLEEVFLGSNFLSTSIVSSDKLSYLSIETCKLKKILIEERGSIMQYSDMATNKIYSLLSRVNQIKKNYIEYYKKSILNQSIIEDNKKDTNTNMSMNLNPQPKYYDYKNKRFLNCVNAYCYDMTKPVDVIQGTPKTMRYFFNKDNNLMNTIKSTMLKLNKKPTEEIGPAQQIEIKDDTTNSDINRNAKMNNNKNIASFSTPNILNTNMKINTKTNSTFSFDVKCRNNYLTVNSMKKLSTMSKYYHNAIKNHLIENREVVDEIPRRMSNNYKTIPLKRINMIDMNKTSHESFINTPSTQRVYGHSEMRFRLLNRSLMTKLRNFEPKYYNGICLYDINDNEMSLAQKDFVRKIEQYFALNLENNGSNIISEKIKDYYRNQKWVGYSNIGLGKNTFHKKNKMLTFKTKDKSI